MHRRLLFQILPLLLLLFTGAAPSLAQIPTASPGTGATAVPTIDIILPIQTSTPNADGSIFHTVQAGENPVSIAEAYGIDLGTFLAQNDLIQNPLIFPGDTLIIRPAPTATATLDVTPTRIPTRTPRPTSQPTTTATLSPSRTPTESLPTLTPTPTPPDPLSAAGLANDPLIWAIGLLAVAGLLLIVVGSVLKRGA